MNSFKIQYKHAICYIVGNMLMRIGIVLLNINEYFHKEQVLLMLFRKLCIFLLS